MKIAFQGPQDVRILSADDLKRHSEVEGFKKTVFLKGKPVEIDDEAAIALIDRSDIYGKFTEVTEDQPVETVKSAEAQELEAQAKKSGTKAAGDGVTTSGTRSGGTTGSGTTSGSTGRS